MRERIAIISVFMLALCLSSNSSAQQKPYLPPAPPRDTSSFWIFKDMTMGPYFTAGITRQNEDLPDDWASKPRFANAFGVTLDASVSTMFGIDLTALYDARSLFAESADDSDNIDINIGYIAFQTSLRIYWLLLGLSFDFPMSGSANESISAYQHYTDGVPDQPLHRYTQNLNVSTSDIAPLTEIRATLSVPLFQEESAILHVIVSGSYPLSKALKGTSSFDTTAAFSGKFAPGQGPLPAIEAGISYQFDLLH